MANQVQEASQTCSLVAIFSCYVSTTVSSTDLILVLGNERNRLNAVAELEKSSELIYADSPDEAIKQLCTRKLSGVFWCDPDADFITQLMQSRRILDAFTDGVALLDTDKNIEWSNKRLTDISTKDSELTGQSFYEVFEEYELDDTAGCPIQRAIETKETATGMLQLGERKYFEMIATPIFYRSADHLRIIISIRDKSEEIYQRQKLAAIHEAGLALGDLSAEEIVEMSVEERIELLTSQILAYSQDLLEYETVEIRLIDKDSDYLRPLLAFGMEPIACDRNLVASEEHNGVTGYVASTGTSYLCKDTEKDSLYITGAIGARSSLTIPLILHDKVLGTFNVESGKVNGFDENDQLFLELFCREIAIALNTLDLLLAEKVTTASESTKLLLTEVAEPVDEILNDAAWVLERYIGHDPDVAERLQRVLKRTRDIRQIIHEVGETLKPQNSANALPSKDERPVLKGKRILVVDNHEEIRKAAHELLGKHDCDVETAHNGEEAFLMVRTFNYDLVMADIRLPDMNGYECFKTVREIHPNLPVILMTGFGYDPTHSIVKARQEGLRTVLYKPFRLEQLLTEVENAVSAPDASGEESQGD